MIGFWLCLGAIVLYVIGEFLEWLAEQVHGGKGR